MTKPARAAVGRVTRRLPGAEDVPSAAGGSGLPDRRPVAEAAPEPRPAGRSGTTMAITM